MEITVADKMSATSFLNLSKMEATRNWKNFFPLTLSKSGRHVKNLFLFSCIYAPSPHIGSFSNYQTKIVIC